jgi:dolichol-phosphate mannosyltransferase
VATPSLVVIPTLNEAENLPALADRLLSLAAPPDILVVDDASPDGTGEIAEALGRETGGRVRVLRRTGRPGLGPAYRDGFALGLGDGYARIAQMDADFSHDPASLPRLFSALDRADLALGSRYVRGGGVLDWGLPRRALSRGGSLYARFLLSLPVSDATGGFKAWRRETLEAVDLPAVRSSGYCFQIEMTFRAHAAGARIREVPILFPDRRVGRSKMSRRIFLEAVWRVLWLRFSGENPWRRRA